MSQVSLVLLAATPAPETPIDPAKVTPGVVGFLVFAALCVATWLLLKSFTSRLAKIRIPPEADGEAPSAPRTPDGERSAPPRGGQSYRKPLSPPHS